MSSAALPAMTADRQQLAERESRAGVQGAGWLAVTATLLSGIAPLLLIAATPVGPGSSDAWVWAWVLTVVVGLRYAWLVAQGAPRLFELVVWLFSYVFLGLAPLVQMRSATYPATTPSIDPSRNAMAMLVVGVGLLAFSFGLLAGGRRTHPLRAGRLEVSTHRLVAVTVAAIALSAYYVSAIGFGNLLGSRSERYTAEVAAWPDTTVGVLIRASATWPLVVSFVALLALRRQRRLAGRAGPSVLPWVVIVMLAVAANPLGSPRYVFGTALLAVLVALGAASRPRRFRVFALLLAVGLVLLFPYADIAREAGQRGTKKEGGPARVLTTGDFDAVDQINNTLRYVDVEGHTRGQQLGGAVLFWVPRNIWEDKPKDTGVFLADFRGYTFKNLSAPLWAEFFIDGGWLLLVAGMAMFGWVVRRSDQLALALLQRYGHHGVIATTVPFYLVIVLRGSLLQAMAGLAVLIAGGLFVTRRVPT